MSYINTALSTAATAGGNTLRIPRYTPLNPAESPDSNGDYASGVVDTFHALKAGDLVFDSTTRGVPNFNNARIKSLSSNVTETTIVLNKNVETDMDVGHWITIDQYQNATKGAKVSFSKYPVQSITAQVPLFDIVSGDKLVDETGIELVTDADVAIREIANSENATGVVVPTGIGTAPVPVAEVFKETTETSTTLLGIDRAEEQLSLFSDVSTLGLNPDEWEFFTLTGGSKYGPWDTRGRSKIY